VGLVGYVSALVAQYYGAGEHQKCTRSVIQALIVAVASYPILLAFIPIIQYVFILSGQDAALADQATVYARILLVGSIFLVWRTGVGAFFIGIGKTRLIMYANVAGALVNIPLNYVLIFGKFGLPELGIRGAALGTVIAGVFICATLSAFYLRETSRAPYRIDHRFQYDADIMKRLLQFGIPAGIAPFLNWFAFNVFVQVMHAYGPDTAAAATIAFNWDAVSFIPLLGLGMTASTVVGQQIGARNHDGAQRAAYIVVRISLLYAAAMVILFVGFAEPLTALFASGFADPGGPIKPMGATMLRLLAIHTIAIAAKLVIGGSLRAAGDTTWLMWVSVAIHWVMAIAVILLARVFHVHQYIAWSTLIIMNYTHFFAVWYRFRSGVWREKRLIG
jgi:MATE family multidrug resistance protein